MPYSLSENNTHQGTGCASVQVCKFPFTKDPLSVRSADPKNSADLRPQADGSAVGTSLAATPRSSTMSKSSIRFRRLDPRCYRCFFPPFPAAMAAKAAAESSRSVHITRVELDTRVHNVRCCAWPQHKCRAAVMGHFIFQRLNSVVLNRITLEIACSLRFSGNIGSLPDRARRGVTDANA